MIFVSSIVFGQIEERMNDSKEFISNRTQIYEPNPSYLAGSKMIDSLFHDKLTNFPNNTIDTCDLARLLIDNSLTEYDDSQDSYRYSVRRFMIFSILALSLSPDKTDFYIDLAEKSLVPKNSQIDLTLIDSYSGLLVMTLMIKDTNHTLNSISYKSLLSKFESLKNLIDKDIYDKGLKIITTFEKK